MTLSQPLPYPLQHPDVDFWAAVYDQDLDNQTDVWYENSSAFAELWRLNSDERKKRQGERIADACTRHLVRKAELR